MKIDLDKIYSGKVRDLYQVSADKMLMVATDRFSAFDVIFDDLIPGKGEILTQMSNAWFKFFADTIPNHLIAEPLSQYLPSQQAHELSKRAVLIKKLKPIKIEAVVRGYLAGGGWKEYQKQGSVSGISLPQNLKLAQKLPEPIFTPSIKADVGDHDISMDFETVSQMLGIKLATQLKNSAIKLYQKAAHFALDKGIIIADTKFEFGLDEQNQLTLMDEVLTPDSSRFWDAKSYQVGFEPLSYDKQFVRNWLEQTAWNKEPPPPKIPENIIAQALERYQQIFSILFF